MKTLEDENNSFRQRNDAIWSLGQLGDERAEYVLLTHYSKEIPAREPYNQVLSTYEVDKALKLIESGFNPTRFTLGKILINF